MQTLANPSQGGRFGLTQQPEELTPREQQVMNIWLRPGATYYDVANELLISKTTAKTHIANAYNKLGVSRRGEAYQKLLALFATSAAPSQN